jgi:hypothetical protein
MKRGIIIAYLIGLMAAVGARAAETSPPPPKPTGDQRPARPNMMENVLPPRVLDELALTADQKTKYDDLNASFKRDAAKWRADNNYDPEKARAEMQKAREANDQEAIKKLGDRRKGLMDLRKSYTDKLRGLLTDDQKTKLDAALARGPGRGPRGGPNPGGPPPPLPPPDK